MELFFKKRHRLSRSLPPSNSRQFASIRGSNLRQSMFLWLNPVFVSFCKVLAFPVSHSLSGDGGSLQPFSLRPLWPLRENELSPFKFASVRANSRKIYCRIYCRFPLYYPRLLMFTHENNNPPQMNDTAEKLHRPGLCFPPCNSSLHSLYCNTSKSRNFARISCATAKRHFVSFGFGSAGCVLSRLKNPSGYA